MTARLCGRTLSDFGIGTWGIGGNSTPDSSRDNLQIETLRYALDQGINVIDTAEMYAAGHTEEVVGKAISPYEREDLFLISKVWHTHLKSEDVLKSARQSLKRLDTDYLDLYLIHFPNSSVPIKETISAMERLVSDGLVRNIGVSNFNVKEMKDAMAAAQSCEIAANQIEYSYAKRGPESDVIPFCEKNKVDVIAYTPIMKGNVSSHSALAKISTKNGVSPVQVALKYVMRRSYAIPKSSNREHIDELLGTTRYTMSDQDYNELSGKS